METTSEHLNLPINTDVLDVLIDEINLVINSDFTYIVTFLHRHNIHPSWYKLFVSTYKKLVPILRQLDEMRINGSENIFPLENDVFRVFTKSIDEIKIVLLGQDPYPTKDHAMGLAFSVNKNIPMAKSVSNIFKELKIEYPERKYKFTHGDLTAWADKGIFLLNSALTVIESKPNSQQFMWTWFTDLCIEYLCKQKSDIVFLLFGSNAISKSHIIKNIIDKPKIVTCTHPSPMSAYNGFFKSDVFKRVDALLDEPFDWSN
jgi:uracil-DNA glycosylase